MITVHPQHSTRSNDSCSCSPSPPRVCPGSGVRHLATSPMLSSTLIRHAFHPLLRSSPLLLSSQLLSGPRFRTRTFYVLALQTFHASKSRPLSVHFSLGDLSAPFVLSDCVSSLSVDRVTRSHRRAYNTFLVFHFSSYVPVWLLQSVLRRFPMIHLFYMYCFSGFILPHARRHRRTDFRNAMLTAHSATFS